MTPFVFARWTQAIDFIELSNANTMQPLDFKGFNIPRLFAHSKLSIINDLA